MGQGCTGTKETGNNTTRDKDKIADTYYFPQRGENAQLTIVIRADSE